MQNDDLEESAHLQQRAFLWQRWPSVRSVTKQCYHYMAKILLLQTLAARLVSGKMRTGNG